MSDKRYRHAITGEEKTEGEIVEELARFVDNLTVKTNVLIGRESEYKWIATISNNGEYRIVSEKWYDENITHGRFDPKVTWSSLAYDYVRDLGAEEKVRLIKKQNQPNE